MKKKILALFMAMVLSIGGALITGVQPVEASMTDEAEKYDLQTEYKGRIESYPERYFEFNVTEKSYVSLKVKWKVDSGYNTGCKFSIYSSSGKEVLKSEDVYDSYNSVSEEHTGTAGRILSAGTYYLQVGTGSSGTHTNANFSFQIQAEKQIQLSRGVVSSLKSSKAGAMTVLCKADSNAIGYRIQFSTDYTFKKSVKTLYSAERTKTISGLKKGTRYYVKICPYNVYDDGSYVFGQNSLVKTVVTKK